MKNINIINPTDKVTLEDVKSFENEMSIKACLKIGRASCRERV